MGKLPRPPSAVLVRIARAERGTGAAMLVRMGKRPDGTPDTKRPAPSVSTRSDGLTLILRKTLAYCRMKGLDASGRREDDYIAMDDQALVGRIYSAASTKRSSTGSRNGSGSCRPFRRPSPIGARPTRWKRPRRGSKSAMPKSRAGSAGQVTADESLGSYGVAGGNCIGRSGFSIDGLSQAVARLQGGGSR